MRYRGRNSQELGQLGMLQVPLTAHTQVDSGSIFGFHLI